MVCGKWATTMLCAIVLLTHMLRRISSSPLALSVIYMKGGEYSYNVTKRNETGTVINTTEDYTKITGTFVDLCAELKAALNGGGGEEEDTCVSKAEDDCNEDENCMWKHKKK